MTILLRIDALVFGSLRNLPARIDGGVTAFMVSPKSKKPPGQTMRAYGGRFQAGSIPGSKLGSMVSDHLRKKPREC